MFKITSSEFSRHLKDFRANQNSILSSDTIGKILSELGYEYRSRIFNPELTLHGFLTQALQGNVSCMRVVSEIAAYRAVRGLKSIALNTSSYARARARLPVQLVQRVAKELGLSLRAVSDKAFDRVFVVDGTTISMSDTKQNLAMYPKHGGDNLGKGFPYARVLALFSLSTGGLSDLAISPNKGKGTGELSLMKRLWVNLRAGDTILADALFSNFEFLLTAKIQNITAITEYAKRSHGRMSKKKSEQIIQIPRPRKSERISQEEYDEWPEFLNIRLVRIRYAPKGYRPKSKIVVTTDLKKLTHEEITSLYQKRWHVELNFRSIKETMGMGCLRSKSPEMFEKEIWVFALAYNLVRCSMVEAAGLCKKVSHEISFQNAMTLLNYIRTLAPYLSIDKIIVSELLSKAPLVGKRPGRYEPRAIKRRKKNYAFLSTTRKEAKKTLHKKVKRKKSIS